jgi:hypothetical protein
MVRGPADPTDKLIMQSPGSSLLHNRLSPIQTRLDEGSGTNCWQILRPAEKCPCKSDITDLEVNLLVPPARSNGDPHSHVIESAGNMYDDGSA